MDIKITADYTKEQGEILVCTHENTGDTLSIMAGNLYLQVTVDQVKNLINRLNIGINIVEEYRKMIKKSGSGNGG
uniref:Uncharacterized protein n=1 Tax=viral metagenome TaxID=1070528 RepID=A0A6M3XZC4_9ZZZZ